MIKEEMHVDLFGLTISEIKLGDDLTMILADCARKEAGGIKESDMFVVTNKIISK
jgi:F420-0:gamma-glutamyl ligase